MAAQKGKDLLLRIALNSTSSFETVAGIRTRTISFSSGTVDTTHSESPGQWRELLAGGGVRGAKISGQGIFKDAASDARMRQLAFSGDTPQCEIVFPDFGVLMGPFQVTQLDYSGDFDREIMFEVTLESAGAIAFQAEAA